MAPHKPLFTAPGCDITLSLKLVQNPGLGSSKDRNNCPDRTLCDMAKLYDNWCHDEQTIDSKKTLWRLSELAGGREYALDKLPSRVLNHYISDEEIAEFLEVLEYPEVAECIRELLPETANGRSGDLGEILAAEFVDERLGYKVPVRRLRSKDHREMAMRGEDVIGATYDVENRLKLLKGEAKSARRLSRATVAGARRKLDENHGRPSAHSLIFIARQLIQSEDQKRKDLGREILREATQRAIPKSRLAHLLFTLSGNRVDNFIQEDFDAVDGAREQHSVNLKISDHSQFVEAVYDGAYEEARSIGNG